MTINQRSNYDTSVQIEGLFIGNVKGDNINEGALAFLLPENSSNVYLNHFEII